MVDQVREDKGRSAGVRAVPPRQLSQHLDTVHVTVVEVLEELLVNLASAYQASRRVGLQSVDEVNVLVGQVVSELRKMDESLKVLGVCLDRLRKQMKVPPRPPMLH